MTTSSSTKVSKEETDSSKAHWFASDWDEPLDIAVVFNSVQNENGKCGHALTWDPLICSLESRQLTTCPICEEPIALVCDGAVASGSSPGQQVVTFKFGKQIFRLSVPSQASESSPKAKTSLFGWIVSFLSPFSQNSKKIETAQQRMAQALGIIGIKILYKGKVLYHEQQQHQSSQAQPAAQSLAGSTDLSNRLLEISQSGWESKKASLVVMGTRAGSELVERGEPTTSWENVWLLPFHILQSSLAWCWKLFGVFAKSLLPSSQPPHQD
jgi:hypothetical protein